MSLSDSADGQRAVAILSWNAWLDDNGSPTTDKEDKNYRHAAIPVTILTDALRRSGFPRG